MKCSHDSVKEFRKTPPRFIDRAGSYTLEQVLNMPINLKKAPFEYASISPTPLDPSAVKIEGVSYPHAAEVYMLDRAHQLAPRDVGEHIVRVVEDEIRQQHGLRMMHNEAAFDRWREIAATDASSQKLSHERAEGIMQIRSGLSGVNAIIKLLELHPEIEAVEISKATRPYCVEQFGTARGYSASIFGKLATRADMDVTMTYDSPYRQLIDQDGVIVTKSLAADIVSDPAGRNVAMQAIRRDSVVGVDKGSYNGETINGSFGSLHIDTIPIDTTQYIRISPDQAVV